MSTLRELQLSANYYLELSQSATNKAEKSNYKKLHNELLESCRKHKKWLQLIEVKSS